MKFFLRLITYLLLCSPIAASVRILENSTSRLVFRWELGTFDTVTVRDSGRLATSLGFSGQNIMLGSEGEPAIPGFSVYAGIPASGAVRVSFIPGPARTVTLNHPLINTVTERGKALSLPQDLQFADPWISSPRYSRFKNMRVANCVIRPFRYDARAHTIQVLASGECTVEFPAGSPVFNARPAASAYQRMVKGLVLNYTIASAWAAPLRKRGPGKTADPFPFQSGQPLLTFTIGDGHAGMNEVTIKENGILKLSGAQIKRIFGSLHAAVDTGSIAMNRVALYASWKGILPMACPAVDSIPAGSIELPLYRCDIDGDGFVDNNDCFLSYVTGLSDWGYDSLLHDYFFNLDNYDDNRHYWLTIKPAGTGASMSRFVQPSGSTETLPYSSNHVMFREPKVYPKWPDANGNPNRQDMIGWVWVSFIPPCYGAEFSVQLDLPDLDTAAGGTVQFNMLPDYSNAQVMATIDGDTISTYCQNGIYYAVQHWGNRRLRIVYTDPYTNNYFQLQNIRVDYRRQLSANTDSALRMHVFSFNDTGVKSYRLLSTGSGRLYLFRLPCDESSATVISDTVLQGNPYVWSDSGNTGTRYFLCNDAGLLVLPDSAFSPPPLHMSSSSGFVVSNLRDLRNTTDYLIVTPPEFLSEADRLAAHKAQRGFVSPRVVSINDIYTDFSGGNTDLAALRNFLAFTVRNWQDGDKLAYVLFMGKGHYDYKRIQSSTMNWIPPAEVDFVSLGRTGTWCEDDYYAALFPGGAYSSDSLFLAVGRLPCQTLGEAKTMVSKIIEVEDPDLADWGSWRNAMLLVADDDMQGKNRDGISGNQNGHHASSERVAELAGSLQPSMDLRKTYLFDYPWNAAYAKPEAEQAIINEINAGVGYVNYFGHGSFSQWTDERVMSQKDVLLLNNAKRYPLISGYSCSVGLFDQPDVTSLSELLVKVPGAGAIASFSSTRPSAAPSNTTLALNIYAALFDSLSPTFGMAILKAKILNHDGYSRVYVLLGDPSLQLVKPLRRVQLEVHDKNDSLLGTTLMALQQITIKGSIVDNNGIVDGQFGRTDSAFVHLGIFNPPEITRRKDGGDDPDSVRWVRPGKPIFSGRTAVHNGSFEQTAILPLSISFDKIGARLTAYAWEGSTDGLGCRDSLLFHGTDTTSSQLKDTTGPRITIRPVYDMESMRQNSASFSDHIVSSLPLKCEIVLFDQSGINAVDNGPDQGLTVEVPGVMTRRNINYKFQFAQGDYRSGTAILSFEENSLKTGHYRLLVTAQDLLGNVSQATFTLEITDINTYSLDHVFNTPNPMRMGESTRFFFYPSTTTTQNFVPALECIFIIKIYSLGGKLLRVIKNAYNGESWNGGDQTGYPLPPNVYLYQVTADYPSQEKLIKSKIQKLVIHPPGR